MNRIGLVIKRRVFMIVVAILFAILGLTIYWYINNLKGKNSGDVYGIEVYTATVNIDSGTEISEDMVQKKKIPSDIYNSKFISEKKDIIEKTAATGIVKNEILTIDKIEGSALNDKGYLNFSDYIPYGCRAVSIPVLYFGEYKLLAAGDFVDIISTYYDRASDELVCSTILPYKEIILIDGKSIKRDKFTEDASSTNAAIIESKTIFPDFFSGAGNASNNSNSVVLTFYLLPYEVEVLVLAQQMGSLNISICPQPAISGY